MTNITVNKNLLIGIVVFVVVLVIIGTYAIKIGNGSTTTNAPGYQPNVQLTPKTAASPQDIYIHANADGTYDKNQITVTRGIPVRLHFSADQNAGCGRQIVLYGLSVNAVSQSGEEQVVEFTPTTPGSYQYSCGMRMWGPGQLTVQ